MTGLGIAIKVAAEERIIYTFVDDHICRNCRTYLLTRSANALKRSHGLKKPMKCLVNLLCCFVCLQVQGAEVYTWTDEHGNKHFGDNPPAVADDGGVKVSKETYELKNVDKGYPDYEATRQFQRRTQAKKTTDRSETDQATSTIEQCKNDRTRLARMISGVSDRDENGEPIYVSSAQLFAEEKALQAKWDRDCANLAVEKLIPRPVCGGALSAPHLTAAEFRALRKQLKERCREKQREWDLVNR